MRRFVYPGALVAAATGIFAYSVLVIGRTSGSAVFLALSALMLMVGANMLFRAAIALFTEPPTVELAIATGRRRKELEREKQALLKALKELEFDHEMRKVSDADFTEISGAYRARAIRVMRLLDDRQVDYASLVEEELQRHKRKSGRARPTSSTTQPAGSNVSIGVDAATPQPSAEERPKTATNGCPSCATANDRDAVYCKKCATRLVAAEGAAS